MPEVRATPKRSFTVGGVVESRMGSTTLRDSGKNLFTHAERVPLANLLDSAYLLNTKTFLLVFRSYAEDDKSSDVTAVQSGELGTMNVAGVTLETLRMKCNLSSDYKFVLESGDVMAESTTLGSYIELISENVQSLKALSTANESKVARLCIYYARTSNAPAAVGILPVEPQHDPDHPCSGIADTARSRQSITPGKMCEKQWESVVNTAKLTCGVVFEEDKIEWARKPAFKLNRPMLATGDDFPLFNVRDDSGMEVAEIDSQQQERSHKFGFDDKSFGFAAEISGFWSLVGGKLSLGMEKNKTENTVQGRSSNTKKLEVTHNYPRVEVFLGSECLQLTEVCKQSLNQLLEAEATDDPSFINLLDKFLKDYGAFFSTKKVLGGKISFKRELHLNQTTNLEEEKQKMKLEAKVSVEKSLHLAGIPVTVGVSPGMGLGYGSGKSNYEFNGLKTGSIVWEAVGGDTTLTDPGQWRPTVKDHELWRVLQHQETVSLLQLISEIHPDYDPIHVRYLNILEVKKQEAAATGRMLSQMRREQEERAARRLAEFYKVQHDKQVAQKESKDKALLITSMAIKSIAAAAVMPFFPPAGLPLAFSVQQDVFKIMEMKRKESEAKMKSTANRQGERSNSVAMMPMERPAEGEEMDEKSALQQYGLLI